ncbi:hypothetical protein MRB53_040224 [Persea americana]|nr:hypothetical protein MRB53_040224 [Persea americana]
MVDTRHDVAPPLYDSAVDMACEFKLRYSVIVPTRMQDPLVFCTGESLQAYDVHIAPLWSDAQSHEALFLNLTFTSDFLVERQAHSAVDAEMGVGAMGSKNRPAMLWHVLSVGMGGSVDPFVLTKFLSYKSDGEDDKVEDPVVAFIIFEYQDQGLIGTPRADGSAL